MFSFIYFKDIVSELAYRHAESKMNNNFYESGLLQGFTSSGNFANSQQEGRDD